jgi:hypothetical protein
LSLCIPELPTEQQAFDAFLLEYLKDADSKEKKKSTRKTKIKDKLILNEIEKYLEMHGIYGLTALLLQKHLKEVFKASTDVVPSLPTIQKILRETFHLKFGRLNKANVKYSDAMYNEKRLWISRLLAQFFLEQVIIISVDESNFKSDALPHMQWRFNPVLGKRKRVQAKRRKSAAG